MTANAPSRPPNVLIVNSTNATTSSGHLFAALREGLERHAGAAVTISHLNSGARKRWGKLFILLPRWKRLRAVWDADIVVTHTAMVLALQEIMFARLLGKRVFAIYWDAYPESFAHLGEAPSRALTPIAWLERFLLRRAHKVMPPSDDYLPHLRRWGLGSQAQVFAMWPFTPIIEVAATHQPEAGERPLSVAFAGAVNPIRGLDAAMRQIVVASAGPVVIHSYGQTAPDVPKDLENDVRSGKLLLEHHGFVDQNEIVDRLRAHDLGLVSLSPQFQLPAFPSKTVSYVCAGLAILYTGPALPALSAFLERTGTGVTMDKGLTDLHAAAHSLRDTLATAQTKAIAELNLDEARIASFLQ